MSKGLTIISAKDGQTYFYRCATETCHRFMEPIEVVQYNADADDVGVTSLTYKIAWTNPHASTKNGLRCRHETIQRWDGTAWVAVELPKKEDATG